MSIGVSIFNSNVLVASNYILDGGTGVGITTQGLNAATPLIEDNVIAGNNNGIIIIDAGTGSLQTPIGIINNDIVENQVGIFADVTSTSPIMADIGNNIFWENHDLTPARNGAAIVASTPNKLFVQGNLFSGNGPSETSPADDTINVGGGFNPAVLGPTPDQFGNFTGNPAFVSPFDPRPASDGPGEFFQDADFDLTSASAAINAAIPSIAPPYDLLYRSPVPIAGKGFPGTGPASVGAFYFDGIGGIPIGGAFRVASSSLATGGAALAAGGPVTASATGQRDHGRLLPARQSQLGHTQRPGDLGHRRQLGEPGPRDQPRLDRRPHRRVHALGELQQHGDRQPLHPGRLDPDRR